jgi:predicted RecA/RadA family phage recombinase
MAKNHVAGNGVIIPVLAPYDVSAGNMLAIGALHGVAQANAASGARVDIECYGGPVKTLSSITTIGISVGDRLFWNTTSKWVDKTTTGQYCVGIAVPLDTLSANAKAAGGTTVRVLLHSAFGAGVI